ncbi:uncharacterized protein LOC131024609 [Salvia miltiorrhiza]|uniref:uncharacterized protein LOC131024609 n=1 Tax=Salvia miltiorrhiza TaxID=226208 RepID=UPI0025ABB2CE|nr:uncharacterized protein LOC131024609 [Salvia miltiorrhiza]
MASEISPHIQAQLDMATPDVQSVAMKIQRARQVYDDKPTNLEILLWYLYELSSYFIHAVLIPIVFPLIISQTVSAPTEPPHGWLTSFKDLNCTKNQMQIYAALIQRKIRVGGGTSFSPLEWTSISWITGLLLSTPILYLVSTHLDHGHRHQLIAAAATGVGSLFCLPAGFLRKSWIFPPYVAAIVAASTVVGASHARHLGLMITGFTGESIPKRHFPDRRSFGSWLSLHSTAAGCLGAALISSFTYHMLNRSDHFTSLWVISIFSGLKWGSGMIHIFSTSRAVASFPRHNNKIVSIFKYPHAARGLVAVFLSSFTGMCVFGGGMLYAIGYICVEKQSVLYLWLMYFLLPMFSLPLTYPLQQLLKLDAEKMQLLGFTLSIFTSGFGFYYRSGVWSKYHLFFFAAVQGTSAGLLHAFGRVLWLDCSPRGREGEFSVWFSWARAVGACAGFGLATAIPGDIGKVFGVSFCTGVVGMIIVIFGNISSLRGAEEAGHVGKSNENSSQMRGFDDDNDYSKESVLV